MLHFLEILRRRYAHIAQDLRSSPRSLWSAALIKTFIEQFARDVQLQAGLEGSYRDRDFGSRFVQHFGPAYLGLPSPWRWSWGFSCASSCCCYGDRCHSCARTSCACCHPVALLSTGRLLANLLAMLTFVAATAYTKVDQTYCCFAHLATDGCRQAFESPISSWAWLGQRTSLNSQGRIWSAWRRSSH